MLALNRPIQIFLWNPFTGLPVENPFTEETRKRKKCHIRRATRTFDFKHVFENVAVNVNVKQ